MSKVIEVLNRLFAERFIILSPETINEPSENLSRRLIKGKNLPNEDILVCRLDQENTSPSINMFPYLRPSTNNNGLKGMRRICDYAIFIDNNDVLFVLLFELKKGKDSPQEQLNLTVPLIDFIFERAKILNHLKDVTYEIRKIGITDSVDKRSTSDRGNIQYDDNNFVKLYNSNCIYLQRLLH